MVLILAPGVWAQESGTLNGSVVDKRGKPLPGVTVSLEKEDGGGMAGSGVTGLNGTYEIGDVAPGSYRVVATLDGFAEREESVTIVAGSQSSVDFVMGTVLIEHVVVRGEFGDQIIIDRPMTVTGFNQEMVVELGMNNNNDLEMLTPGLQLGHRTLDSGHSSHIYMRGIGSEMNQEEFSDTAVSTYVDGIYTDDLYGLEPGNMWDVERMEVARGPQVTGGKGAMAGSISYYTVKPTADWDLQVQAEVTDQTAQRFNVALGGPIGEGGFAWRLTGGVWDGDGAQPNIGPGGDYDEPDQISYAPQIRHTGKRSDINLRYSRVEDTGAPRTQVELTGRDTTTECFLFATDPQGNEICTFPNPFFGAEGQSPSVRNCDVDNPDQLICDGNDLQNIVDFNTSGNQDSIAEIAVLDVNSQIGESMALSFKAGRRESKNSGTSDTDGTSRVGAGADPFTDENGNPVVDDSTNYIFDSEQDSLELSLYSSFEGPFQFVLGGYYREGDEPYVGKFFQRGDPLYSTDNNAICQGLLPFFGLPLFNDFGAFSEQAAIELYGCPGDLPSPWSNTGEPHPTGGNLGGEFFDFFSHSVFESQSLYFNTEVDLNDRWMLYGGARYDVDKKTQLQHEYYFAVDFGIGAPVLFMQFQGSEVPGFEGKRAEWTQWAWNAGFRYAPRPDFSWYGRISQSGRPGGFTGFNTTPENHTYDSEELINYETGVKGLFQGGKLQFEASVFYNDYQTYWVRSSRLLPPERRIPGQSLYEDGIFAIDGSWIHGLELTGAFRPSDRWTIRGFYNYLDSELGPYETLYCCDPTSPLVTIEYEDIFGNTITEETNQTPTNFGGNQMPNQPNHKGSLTVMYDTPPSDSAGSFRVLGTVGYTDTKHTDVSNLPNYFIPEYTRVDARVIYYLPGNQWEVHAFGKNLLDEIAVQLWDPAEFYGWGGGAATGSLTDEREFGLQVVYRR